MATVTLDKKKKRAGLLGDPRAQLGLAEGSESYSPDVSPRIRPRGPLGMPDSASIALRMKKKNEEDNLDDSAWDSTARQSGKTKKQLKKGGSSGTGGA